MTHSCLSIRAVPFIILFVLAWGISHALFGVWWP